MTEQRHAEEQAPPPQQSSAREGGSRRGREQNDPGWRIEGKPAGGGPSPQLPGDSPPGLRWGRVFLTLLAMLAINWLVVGLLFNGASTVNVSYTFFRSQVEAGNVAAITSTGNSIQGTFKNAVTATQATGQRPTQGEPTYTNFTTQLPAFGTGDLLALLQSKGVVVNAKPLGTPLWQTLLAFFGPALLLWALFVWGARRTQAAGGGAGGMLGMFGKSKVRKYEPQQTRTTFADVAGIDEAKEELAEVVDFLQHPERYRKLGARIPRGVLLSGQPGTGKTLLARAVAGEAEVPFFWLSASEFVEMFVGVGASRVRDLFKQAKDSAPAIIFIDELDAIGRARSAGGQMGGNDEREQTLNQILTGDGRLHRRRGRHRDGRHQPP